MADDSESTGGYVANPHQTKLVLAQDVAQVTQFMEGAQMLGTGIQIRLIALSRRDKSTIFQEWWEVRIFDDPHLGTRLSEDDT
ncbi:hypothetical protein [Streptomyces sp. NPDC047071]|uniref:hypothetical protein n=1 Tax=Streptomyces sp. NPDC047071 TaxID=3154808 RepID=UPI003455B2BB